MQVVLITFGGKKVLKFSKTKQNPNPRKLKTNFSKTGKFTFYVPNLTILPCLNK